MVKRRTTILGLGALAMGSGAAFTSAAFENTAAADADFRVVVEDDLVVEPGAAFRQGDDPNDNFDPNSIDAEDWARENGENSFFSSSDDSLESIGRDDGPKVAAMNNATNSDLEIEVATFLDENAGRDQTFEDFLQVRNSGTTRRNVAIGFSEFGSDGDSEEISADDVREIYQFENTGGTQISEESFGDTPNWFTLEAGETRQINLSVDTTEFYEEIVDLATGTNPFEDGERVTTVDLVNEIEFGTQEDDPQDPDNI